jgi:hypothetical protein
VIIAELHERSGISAGLAVLDAVALDPVLELFVRDNDTLVAVLH